MVRARKVQIELDSYPDQQRQILMSKEAHVRQGALDTPFSPIPDDLFQFLL